MEERKRRGGGMRRNAITVLDNQTVLWAIQGLREKVGEEESGSRDGAGWEAERKDVNKCKQKRCKKEWRGETDWGRDTKRQKGTEWEREFVTQIDCKQIKEGKGLSKRGRHTNTSKQSKKGRRNKEKINCQSTLAVVLNSYFNMYERVFPANRHYTTTIR